MTDLRSAPVPSLTPEDHVRGPARAPLVVFYGDFACPRCALGWSRLAAESRALRVVFRHFALKAKDPRAVPLARAAEAAAAQGAFWPFADSLYGDPGHTDDPHLWARCEALGLDLERFEADRRSDATAARVALDVRGGMRAGVTVTPTLFAFDAAHPGPPPQELVRQWARTRID